MAVGIYQKVLGLPPDVVAPDYYQLLGLPKGPVKPEALPEIIGGLLDRLGQAEGVDTNIVGHITREINRARATLMDERQRAEYDRQLMLRRMQDLRVYVERLPQTDSKVTRAHHDALIRRLQAFGIEPDAAGNLVDQRLSQLGMTVDDEVPSDEAGNQQADADILDMVARVTDDQILAGYDAPHAPKEDIRVEASVPQEQWVSETQISRKLAEKPKEEPKPPPPPPPTVDERSKGVSKSKLEKRIATLEAENANLKNSPGSGGVDSAGMRRRWRTLVMALLLAVGFGLGDLLSSLIPVVEAQMDSLLSSLPEGLGPWMTTPAGMATGFGSIAVLGLIAILLAGRPELVGFVIPTVILTLLSLGAGLAPLGSEGALQGRVEELEEQANALKAKIGRMGLTISGADEAADKRVQAKQNELDAARKTIAEKDKALKEIDSRLRSRDDMMQRQATSLVQKIDEIKRLQTENSVLRKSRGDQDKLKKELEATSRKARILEQEVKDKDQTIAMLMAEIARLKRR